MSFDSSSLLIDSDSLLFFCPSHDFLLILWSSLSTVQAAAGANTFVISGESEIKQFSDVMSDMLGLAPGALSQFAKSAGKGS